MVGVSGSADVNKCVNAVGVLVSLLSVVLERSMGVEGSSFSFSGRNI